MCSTMGTNSREYQREYYAANKERRKEQLARSSAKLNERNQQWLGGYLSTHPCVGCGEDDIVVLEFDHVRGEKASGGVAAMIARSSLDRLKAEVAKCDVVCANCWAVRRR